MRRKVPKDLTPVIVGLLVIVVGSMLWNIQESFVTRRREGLENKTAKACRTKNDCEPKENCVNGACK
jgi:hypothetical protein